MGFFDSLFGRPTRSADIPRRDQSQDVVRQPRPIDPRTLAQRDAAQRGGTLYAFYERYPEVAAADGLSPQDISDGVQRERRAKTSLEGQFVGVSEYELPPRTLHFQYMHYGKTLSEGPTAAIRSGAEHEMIGSSAHFSTHAYFGMHDRTIGAANKALWDFSGNFYDTYPDYPGTLMKYNLAVDGRMYVIVTRATRRHEQRDRIGASRQFASQESIMIPAEQWSLAVIPQLDRILTGQPRSTKNLNLPLVEVSTQLLDEALPANWLDADVEQIVVRLLSGERIGLPSQFTETQAQLDMMYRVALCLPEQYSHQMTFAAGAATMSGETRLAFGQHSRTSPRPLLPLAEAYRVQVLPQLRSCRTGRECLKVLAHLKPERLAEIDKVWSS